MKREIRRSTPLGSARRVTVLNGNVENNVKITTIAYVDDLTCVGADAHIGPQGWSIKTVGDEKNAALRATPYTLLFC